MSHFTIYHNPRCSKSRQTLQLLQDKQIEPTIIEYLQNTPSTTELKHLLKQLNLSARELLRTKEAEYKALNLANASLSEDDLLKAMHDHPKLIERPIVTNGKQAVIGRPPENVLEIL